MRAILSIVPERPLDERTLGHPPRKRSPALVVAACLVSTACGGTGGAAPDEDAVISVVASFYPLVYATQRVGGDLVTVTSLTPPGVEPHDLELAPEDLERIALADVVVYLGGGFQPVVEEAVEAEAAGATVDVSDGISLPGRSDEHDGPDSSPSDPHVWLDPTLYAGIVDRVSAVLSEVRAVDASTFQTNARLLDAELATLDEEFREASLIVETRLMITNHAAFGYLAAAYDLDEVAIAGVSPEAEPDPERIAELAALAQARGVTTVFTEDLVSAEVAEILAAEAGLATARAEPPRGADRSAGRRRRRTTGGDARNLETLRDGLVCG